MTAEENRCKIIYEGCKQDYRTPAYCASLNYNNSPTTSCGYQMPMFSYPLPDINTKFVGKKVIFKNKKWYCGPMINGYIQLSRYTWPFGRVKYESAKLYQLRIIK